MKCSNCGYIYNGVGNPSNCPKCGYSFGGYTEEDKGLSTESKVATGIGAAAGLAAGVGMLAYQNRDVVVDASENASVDENIDSNLSNNESLNNESNVVVDSTLGQDEVGEENTNVDNEVNSVTDSSSKNDGGIDTNKNTVKDKDSTVNQETSKEDDKTDSSDSNDDTSSENEESSNEENNDESENDEENTSDADNESDSEDSNQEESGDEESNDDSSGNGSSNNGSTEDSDNQGGTNDETEDDEDLTDTPNTDGSNGSRGGGSGLGDIKFTPRQLDEAVSYFGMGVAGYAGSNTLSAAKECAGDAFKAIQDAANLVSNLNPDGTRLITTTGSDMKSIVSNVRAVTGSNGSWGYVDSLENKAKNLYNSYRKLNSDYEFYVYNDYIKEIEDAHRAGEKSPLETSFENRGMDFESFAASIANGYTNYFEDEIERITEDGAKGKSWKDSLLYRIGVNNESDAYNTYEEVLAGLQDMRDAACITIYTLGTANINDTVLLNMDSHKTEDGVSYREYIEQNVLDGLDKPDYMGEGKPSDEEADDYKSDSQKQLEMVVLDGYTKIPENERKDNHNVIITSVQNHIQDVIDFYSTQKGSEENPEGLVPANHSVYTLAQIGVSNEAFKDGIYLSEDPREYPDGTIVPARSSSGNTFVDLFNQMTSGSTEGRTDRSVFEEQFFLAQTCYDGTERDMYYYQEMLYGCNEETGEFRVGLGNDYILDVINSKDCSEAELRKMFGDDYEQYVTKDENGKYVFTDKVDDTVINNAFFAMDGAEELYAEHPQYFEKDANGNITFAKGITIDYLAFEHFRDKADQSVVANSEIMYQMQALSYLGGYFPANSREYEAQYNSAYSSYEEAHAKWEEEMKKFEDGELDEAPVEPKFEEMYPGLQSPENRFTDQATQESARGIYLALANGDVGIEEFLPDANPYPGVEDIWTGGSMSNIDLMDPAVAQKYGITQGLDLVFSEPAVNYTADELEKYGITGDSDKTTYQSFCDNVLMGMENTNMMLVQNAERYDNVQAIQIQLRQEEVSDTWWDIFEILGELTGLSSNTQITAGGIDPVGLAVNQASNYIDYFTGEKENPIERISEAWDKITTAKSIISICNTSKNENNNTLIELNNKWKWIIPQYSDFTVNALNISDNYDINDFGLTNASRESLEQEIINGMSEEEKAQFTNNRSLEAYVNEIADAREALILLDYMSQNDYNQLTLALGSNDRVRSYLKNFSYLGKHNGEFDQMNSVACLQYIYNTRGTNTFTTLFNSTNSAGFNLEAQYRANLYLENMSAKAYETMSNYIDASPEMEQILENAFNLAGVAENFLETFTLPALNGAVGFVNNIAYAVINPLEDLASLILDKDLKIHNHIPSMNDAIWGYIMSGVDTGQLTQAEVYCMQAFTSIGNMAIPMIVSAVVSAYASPAVGKWVGAGLMGVGAFGGSLENGKREGLSDGYAYTYAGLSAVSELLMERFVGGIFGEVGGTGFKAFFNSILSEMMEESIQELIDPLLSDIAAMIDPQYMQGINGFTDGSYDVGLRELFTDPEGYIKRLVTEDFNPQAVFDSAVTAAISAFFMGAGKLRTATESLLKYNNSNIIDLVSILQQDLINNGYSNTQASIIMSQKLSILLESKIDINKAVQDAMNNQEMKQSYEQWKKDNEAAEANKSFTEKLKGEEDARGEYDYYNYVLEQVFNEITNGNTDGSIPSLLEFDIENLLSKVTQLETEINKLSENIEVNAEKINDLKSQINEILENTIPETRSKLEQMQNEANEIIEKNKAEISELQKDLDKLNEELNNLTETDNNQELIDKINEVITKIQELETQNTILNIRNQSVSLNDLQNRIQTIKDKLEKKISKKQKETLQKELDIAQKNYADALVSEKNTLLKDVVNLQEGLKHDDVNGIVNDGTNVNNKSAIKTLLGSYIIEISKIESKLEQLRNEGVKFDDKTDTSVIRNIESDIESKNKVLTYLNSSIVGVGVLGMGVSTTGTGTISNVIKYIDNKINSLNKEKTDLQKLGNKENQGSKNDSEISKRKHDVKQELKQNREIKSQLLTEMANHGLTENSPITDLMNSIQNDINSYYDINSFSDSEVLAAKNFDVSRRIQLAGVNADVSQNLDSIISNIKELQNIDIENSSNFKVQAQQILDSLLNLKSKLPGLDGIKTKFSEVGNLIKSVDLKNTYDSIVATFTKIINDSHIDMSGINKLKEQLISFKESIVKFYNEGLFKDAIAMSENAAEIMDAEFEVVNDINSRDISESLNIVNSKVVDLFSSLSKLVTDNQLINNLVQSVKNLVQKVQIDPGAINVVNSEISSLKDIINKLKEEIALKDAHSLSMEEAQILDAEFDILQEITAKDFYDSVINENKVIIDSLNKIKDLFKGNNTILDMVNSISTKFNEIRSKVKIESSVITSLREEIIKLKAELALKDAHSLSMEEAQILDAEFEVLDNISASDIYSIALNKYGVNKAIDIINKSVQSINNIIKNIQNISLSKTLHQMIDTMSSKLNSLTQLSQLHTKLNESIEQLRSAIQTKNEANIQKAKESLEKIKNEIVDFVKRNYNRDSLIFESVDTDSSVSQFDSSIFKSIDKLFSDINGVLDKVKLDSTSKFKMFAEVHSLKGRINRVIDNINSLSEVELQQLVNELGSKKGEFIEAVSKLYSLDESIIHEQQNIQQDVALEIDSSIRTSEDLIREAINNNDANAIVEISKSDFGTIETMLKNGNIDFLTVFGIPQSLIVQVVNYVNANNIKIDFGYNAGLAASFINNGLTAGFSIESLNLLSSELLMTLNGSTILNPQQESVLRYIFTYVNNQLTTNIGDMTFLNEIISSISRISMDGSNIKIVDSLISLMPQNLQILTFKQAIAQSSYSNSPAFIKLMYETGSKTMEYIKSVYYTSDGQINSAKILPVLQLFTNQALPANLTHEAINSVLDPIAGSMGQEMRRLYFQFGGSEVLSLNQSFMGIPIRAFVDDVSNMDVIKFKINQFKDAVSKGNIPLAIRQCVKIASFHDMLNPQDYMWAMRYNGKNLPAGFTSGATGGSGNYNFWNGIVGDSDLRIISHEFGHCLDSELAVMFTKGLSHFSDTPAWVNARSMDAQISIDRQSVTDYSANANCEDFADAVREFIMNRTYFESKFPNRAKVLNECLTNFAVNKLNLDSIKDVNSMATLMVNCGVDSNALSQILKQNPSLQSLKDAMVRQFAFSEDAITILKLNDIKDVNSMAMYVTQNGFNRLYADQLLRITTDLQTLKDTFVRDISLNEGNVLSALQIKSATTLSDLSQVLSLYSLDVNKVFGITSNPTIIKDALYRFVYFGEDIIANLYLSNITNPDTMASLMKEVGFNAQYVDSVRSVSEGIRRFRNDFHGYYHPSNVGSVISILAKYSNSGGNVAVSNNQGLFGKNFFSKPSEQINPSVSSVNVKAINEARNAYIKGDIQRVFEIGSRNFEVIQDLLNNNKVDILAYEGISTQMLMDSVKYLNSINNLDSISNMTFELNSKRAVREMLDMGVYNFTVTKNVTETALASCIEHIKKSSSIEGAKLLHAFNANGNTLLADILNSDSIKNVKKLQILANCGNKVLTQLNNQINLETKVKLFETLRGYSVDELLNVDFNNDVQYRRAEIFYNRILSEYSTQMIQKMRIDKALPFKSNSVINMLRMNSSSYANMTENEIMKEICEEKSAGQYKLIELGYGMAIKPLDYKGMDIRFFTNNRDVLSNLYAKFEVFKSYFNTLPKTFIETLNEVNFLDMDDPDNDLYSITENNNINKRFTAAAAGGWGKFYLWRTSLDFLTMTHEIGHSFDTEYYQVVHNKEGFFSEKVTAWKNAKMKDGNSTVTNYGDTALAEDFAESMAYFMKNQTEFTQKYPNRATEIKRMLRELTFVKYGLNNITDMKTLVIHMMNNGISQGQIKSILSQKVTFNAVKNAYMDYMSFGTDIQTSLMTPNNTTFKIRPITMKNSTNAKVNNRTNNKAWFGNRSISNRSSNPLVNQINRAIASGQSVVNVEINNASDMSVQALREISDLTKVQFFVKGIFSDINGNLKAKYNNPRYIARHTYTGAELIAINAKLDQLQSRIDMNLPVSQRARQIYELIASEYNYLRPENGTRDKFNDREYLVSQSLRGVTSNNIIGREGLICAGYASVFKELCTRCGVTADYIRGDVVVDRLTNRTGRHAWNVFLDENGNAIPVDACWRSGGGRDYFGRSDMFAEGRSADADEAFRDYGAIRQQQVQRVQEVQRVQYGFNDAKSMIDFAVQQMDAKYGPGAGINALRRYLKTGELNSMTSANGARNVLSKVSIRDVNAYIQNNSSVDLSIYSGQVRNIFETMARRHGSYDDAMNQLIEYAQTGNSVYITSMNNARNAIQEIPIQAVKQFINNRLSYQYFNELEAAPYVSEMAPAPSLELSVKQSEVSRNNQSFLQNVLAQFRNQDGRVDVGVAEENGVVRIERDPGAANEGAREKSWVFGEKGSFLFKKTLDINYENFGELLGYEFAKLIGLDCAKYELATLDGIDGVISYNILGENESLISGKDILGVVDQYHIKPIREIVTKYNEIMETIKTEEVSLDMKKQAIADLVDLYNNSTKKAVNMTSFVDSINLDNIEDVDSVLNKFTEYYDNMSELYEYDFEKWNAKKAVVVSNNLYDIWTLVDQYCQIKGYKLADGENIIYDLLKMTMYDLILNQGDRHISNWSIILDKTTKTIRFAPIYDNSNICNLNQDKKTVVDKAHAFEKFDKEKGRMNEVKLARALDALSKQLNANDSKIMVEFEDNKVKKNKLDMIEKLLKTSDADTVRMIREICGQFTAENVDALLDNFVSEYGFDLPVEVKTMVRKTIELNMEKINELLEKYDSSGNSTPTSPMVDEILEFEPSQAVSISDESVVLAESTDASVDEVLELMPSQVENSTKTDNNINETGIISPEDEIIEKYCINTEHLNISEFRNMIQLIINDKAAIKFFYPLMDKFKKLEMTNELFELFIHYGDNNSINALRLRIQQINTFLTRIIVIDNNLIVTNELKELLLTLLKEPSIFKKGSNNLDVIFKNPIKNSLTISEVLSNISDVDLYAKLQIILNFMKIDGNTVFGYDVYPEICKIYVRTIFGRELNINSDYIALFNEEIISLAGKTISIDGTNINVKANLFEYTLSDLDDLKKIHDFIISDNVKSVLSKSNYSMLFDKDDSDFTKKLVQRLSKYALPYTDDAKERFIIIFALAEKFNIDTGSNLDLVSKIYDLLLSDIVDDIYFQKSIEYIKSLNSIDEIDFSEFSKIYRTKMKEIVLNSKLDIIKFFSKEQLELLSNDSNFLDLLFSRYNVHININDLLNEILIDYVLSNSVIDINKSDFLDYCMKNINQRLDFSKNVKLSDLISRLNNFVPKGFSSTNIFKTIQKYANLVDIEFLDAKSLNIDDFNSFVDCFNYYINNCINIRFELKDGTFKKGTLNTFIKQYDSSLVDTFNELRFVQWIIVELISNSFQNRYTGVDLNKFNINSQTLLHFLMYNMLGENQAGGGHYDSGLMFPYFISNPNNQLYKFYLEQFDKYHGNYEYFTYGDNMYVEKTFWPSNMTIYEIFDIAFKIYSGKCSSYKRLINGKKDDNILYSLRIDRFFEIQDSSLINSNVICIIDPSSGSIMSFYPEINKLIPRRGDV